MKGIFILYSGLFLLAGCTHTLRSEADDNLDRAERILLTAPDSARKILDGIAPEALSSTQRTARAALLRAEAEYAAGRPLDNDSLLLAALDYYDRRQRETAAQGKALYLRGCVRLHDGDDEGALELFLQAGERLERAEEPHYLGLLYMRLGELCYGEMDYLQAFNYFQKARGAFLMAKEPRQKGLATSNMAATAYQMRRMQQSIRLYTENLALADELHDEALADKCLEFLAMLYVITAQEAPTELTERLETRSKANDYLRANLEMLRGRPERARQWLDRAKPQIATPTDEVAYRFTSMWAEALAGNPRLGMEHLQHYLRITDSLAQRSFRMSAGETGLDYFREQLRNTRYRMRVHTTRMAVAIFAALIVVAGMGYILRQRLYLHRLQSESYIRSAQEARTAYRELYRQTESLRAKGQDAAGPSLAASRFGVIDRLGKTYYEREHTAQQKEAIFQEVQRLITEVSTDPGIQRELEGIVDTTCDGAMLKLRARYPAMKESDRRLLLYVFCGFSPQVISLFLHETIDNVYARKSRLKSRIKASEAPDRELFLALFN